MKYAYSDVIRDEGLESSNLFNTEATETGADDVRGQPEISLRHTKHTRILIVERRHELCGLCKNVLLSGL